MLRKLLNSVLDNPRTISVDCPHPLSVLRSAVWEGVGSRTSSRRNCRSSLVPFRSPKPVHDFLLVI